ncbi:MAG TPA: type II toxin-antitoxin system VapC family toxin [Terracidiphilus sp.]|nr:type II toxin-antitoxin system VapC family toxin [Terracidiphilus sp.]
MIGLDTNVLARFFLQDDRLQSPKADTIMNSLTVEDPGWVGVATILELVWVLESKNRFKRKTITMTLNQLLRREEIVIEQPECVQGALLLFRKGKADFADCLIAVSARAAGCNRTMTFDRTAARDAGMQLVG